MDRRRRGGRYWRVVTFCTIGKLWKLNININEIHHYIPNYISCLTSSNKNMPITLIMLQLFLIALRQTILSTQLSKTQLTEHSIIPKNPYHIHLILSLHWVNIITQYRNWTLMRLRLLKGSINHQLCLNHLNKLSIITNSIAPQLIIITSTPQTNSINQSFIITHIHKVVISIIYFYLNLEEN